MRNVVRCSRLPLATTRVIRCSRPLLATTNVVRCSRLLLAAGNVVRRSRPLFATTTAAVGMLLLAGAARAQQLPPLTPLGGTATELAEPMTLITGVQPLPDGRVVVVDARERAIRIVDFARGTATQIGRDGAGPNEYRTPRTAITWRGDTVLVYDGGNRRLLKVTPAGELRGEIPIPGEIFINRGVTPMAYADARGALYLRLTPNDFMRDERARRRGILARWTPGTTQLDSIAPLTEREPGRPSRGVAHFVREDGWGVTRDGRVAIARAIAAAGRRDRAGWRRAAAVIRAALQRTGSGAAGRLPRNEAALRGPRSARQGRRDHVGDGRAVGHPAAGMERLHSAGGCVR